MIEDIDERENAFSPFFSIVARLGFMQDDICR